ncbi:TPA: hypothetical protein N0F65_004314 [Lagenidium giganteum]|uniref:SAM-dependent MTase RsmB/NOP-type domain-containing protein n=1 Tax=Lagenidium giganteum TaxID=4803 RepID=A0AAV2ZD44_9STRA|nr:TPA: hypothetical protein N0F65_004314 [Lagenidium giganteum]
MSELYKEAAELLNKLEKRQGGLKSLAYADNVVHKRSSFALVCETLRYKPLLVQLLDAVPQFKLAKKMKDKALLYISLYDLLFGKHKKIQGGGHAKKEMMKFANAFREALVRLKIKAKVASNEHLLPPENRRMSLQLPRYVRINTLLISENEVEAFVREFDAQRDPHVRDLLMLKPGTELHKHPLVVSGKLILQDKASCFPAFILHGEHEDSADNLGDVIDACAAPGNKTSHAAMLLKQKRIDEAKCNVFAFDRSAKRLDLLKRRMKLAGADGIVTPVLQSFLDVDVTDEKYASVRSIQLDPSCSGSGMTNRLDHLLDIASGRVQGEDQENEEYEDVASRLQSLADFQLEALLKAFSFPQVQRVAYSTCSVFHKENEEVVLAALTSEQNRTAERPFALRPCLAGWPRRGEQISGLTEEQAKCMVRANGLEDGTNGFFVAYFERTDAAERTVQPSPLKVATPENDQANNLKRPRDEDTSQPNGAAKRRNKKRKAKRKANSAN